MAIGKLHEITNGNFAPMNVTPERERIGPPRENLPIFITFEPPREKTNNLHRRKQRRRSASR